MNYLQPITAPVVKTKSFLDGYESSGPKNIPDTTKNID
jgi:hypothetical protein